MSSSIRLTYPIVLILPVFFPGVTPSYVPWATALHKHWGVIHMYHGINDAPWVGSGQCWAENHIFYCLHISVCHFNITNNPPLL